MSPCLQPGNNRTDETVGSGMETVEVESEEERRETSPLHECLSDYFYTNHKYFIYFRFYKCRGAGRAQSCVLQQRDVCLLIETIFLILLLCTLKDEVL